MESLSSHFTNVCLLLCPCAPSSSSCIMLVLPWQCFFEQALSIALRSCIIHWAQQGTCRGVGACWRGAPGFPWLCPLRLSMLHTHFARPTLVPRLSCTRSKGIQCCKPCFLQEYGAAGALTHITSAALQMPWKLLVVPRWLSCSPHARSGFSSCLERSDLLHALAYRHDWI